MTRLLIHALIGAACCVAVGCRGPENVLRYDVAVYGGTAGGAIAAIAAANEGADVVLLEPRRHIGGMVSGGLGRTDFGNRSVVGGYCREYFRRVGKHYGEEIGWFFEPHVAEQVFLDWLDEAGVDVRFEQPLRRVDMRDGRIVRASIGRNTAVDADVYIDATYEGDLMAMAGVSYTWGREGQDVYGESLAGRRAETPKHQFDIDIPARDESGELWPLVSPEPPVPAGAEDKNVQAYNFRLCLSDDPANQVPFPRPPGYDPERYALLREYLQRKGESITLHNIMHIAPMPNGKTDVNNNGPFSSDHIGGSKDYPDADPERRTEIWLDHVKYVQGWIYFLANDPGVPPHIQNELKGFGLAKDEFVDTGHWPHQLYIREARRMLGAYVMKQQDTQENLTKPDSVGMGSYNMDSHNVQRIVDEQGFVRNEGDMQIGTKPYEIAYRSLVPRSAECTNLLVPVCMSASHAAYSSIRMEPVYMILGQSSGTAAAHAAQQDIAVQKVPMDWLQTRLVEEGQVISLEYAVARYMRSEELPGVVVDDSQARCEGSWASSTSVGPYVDQGYLHDNNANKGAISATFVPDLPEAGLYEVRLAYTPNPNRCARVPVVVRMRDGAQTIYVNQKQTPEEPPFIVLGQFEMGAGGEGSVTVSNSGTTGHVIADAVQWIRVEGPQVSASGR